MFACVREVRGKERESELEWGGGWVEGGAYINILCKRRS